MKSIAGTVRHAGVFDETAVIAAGVQLREKLGANASCALAFVSSDYLPHLEDFTELIRVHGRIPELIGCTANGLIAGPEEFEAGSGFVVLGFRFNEILANPYSFTRAQLESADDGFWKESAGVQEPRAWLALLNPVDLDVEEWLTEWNIDYPNVPCVGGFASGTDAEGIAVFHNGVRVDGGALIAFSGAVDAETVVSQGCRPIGEPLPVTRAEANVVYSLGSRPAYQALEAAYQTLADTEKAHARGNLFAGLASNEYVEDFKSGDFLVRNIIGADPETGAVVINGVPRVGQTMQYQFRDRTLADADLRACIATSIQPGSDAIAAIVFTCLGRGVKFFETENHDAALIAAAVTPAPVAGFFCSAEIGPIAGINSIHAYTASALILRER